METLDITQAERIQLEELQNLNRILLVIAQATVQNLPDTVGKEMMEQRLYIIKNKYYEKA